MPSLRRTALDVLFWLAATLALPSVGASSAAPVTASDGFQPPATRSEGDRLAAAGVDLRTGGTPRLPAVPRLGARVADGESPLQVAAEAAWTGRVDFSIRLLEDWLGGRLEPQVPSPGYLERTRSRFLLGWLQMHRERYNLASESFTRVRLRGGPLAPFAAWYEARCDHARGRHRVAARECLRYRERWPRGRHAEDCLFLMGEAYTAAGYRQPAIDAYQAYIEADPERPDAELARLGMARAEANISRSRGISALREIALNHDYPTTGLAAREALAHLDAGAATALDEPVFENLAPLAWSAHRARDVARSWKLFRHIEVRLPDDPDARRFARDHASTFAWRARRHRRLAEEYTAAYEVDPDPRTCWLAHRALARGGYWKEAAAWGETGLKNHGRHWRWRRATEHVARAHALAGNHERALALWDVVGNSGGSVGREARWNAAWNAWRAGALEDAATRMRVIQKQDPARALRALYFLGRVRQAQDRTEEARTRFRQVVEAEPQSWYALLARQRLGALPDGSPVHDGRWMGPPPAKAIPVSAPTRRPASPALALAEGWRTTTSEPRRWSRNWAVLAHGSGAGEPVVGTGTAGPTSNRAETAKNEQPPPVPPAKAPTAEASGASASLGPYADPHRVGIRDFRSDNVHVDLATGRRLLRGLARSHRSTWPDLEAAVELAEAGVWELAADIVGQVRSEIDGLTHPARSRPVSVPPTGLNMAQWRQVFLYARDAHHASRFSMGLDGYVEGERPRLDALRAAYPLVFPHYVWPACRRNGIDPYLVIGLIRQESLYRSWAVSPAGALGLMQVMPTTGALVARDLGRERYSPRDLEDPSTNIAFGTWYLARLLERFQGVLPLAVAGYNAGPHNVSSWLREQPPHLGVDDFVESIPYDETRGYVRRVLGFYALYVSLYVHPDAVVRVEPQVAGELPGIVNY